MGRRRRIWRNKPPEVRERLKAERSRLRQEATARQAHKDQKPEPVKPEIKATYEALSPDAKAAADNMMANFGMSMERIISGMRG